MKPQRRIFLGPLTALQIKLLCRMANEAFKAARKRGAVDDDMTAEEYRRAGQMEAAQVDSLKKANQGHFLSIRGKWWTVIGNLEQAFYDFLNEGPVNEERRQMAWRLAGQVAALAEALGVRESDKAVNFAIQSGKDVSSVPPVDPAEFARQAWAYTRSIAQDKFKRRIESLDTDALEQLGFTIVNRTSAIRGVGDSSARNKSQRRSKKTAKTPLQSYFSSSDREAPALPPMADSGSNRL